MLHLVKMTASRLQMYVYYVDIKMADVFVCFSKLQRLYNRIFTHICICPNMGPKTQKNCEKADYLFKSTNASEEGSAIKLEIR